MAEVIDEVRWKIETGSDGQDKYVLEQHAVTIQADPNTGIITKTAVGWSEADKV